MTNLKHLATKHEAFDGQLVYWLLPFDNLQIGILRDQLDRVAPRFEYRHKKTGEVVYVEPEEHRKAVDAAEKTGVNVPSKWEVTELWGTTHTTFLRIECAPEIEFALNDDSPAYLRAFEQYRANRNGSVAANFELWTQLGSQEVMNSFWTAFAATRNITLFAPDVDETDPEASSDGENS